MPQISGTLPFGLPLCGKKNCHNPNCHSLVAQQPVAKEIATIHFATDLWLFA